MGAGFRPEIRARVQYARQRRKARGKSVQRRDGRGGRGLLQAYAQAAADSGVSVAQFKASLHRARVRFREILLEEVADTVEGDAEGEVMNLLRILSA